MDLAADPRMVPVSGSVVVNFSAAFAAARPGADPWRRSQLLRDWAVPIRICRSIGQTEEKQAAIPPGFSTPSRNRKPRSSPGEPGRPPIGSSKRSSENKHRSARFPPNRLTICGSAASASRDPPAWRPIYSPDVISYAVGYVRTTCVTMRSSPWQSQNTSGGPPAVDWLAGDSAPRTTIPTSCTRTWFPGRTWTRRLVNTTGNRSAIYRAC